MELALAHKATYYVFSSKASKGTQFSMNPNGHEQFLMYNGSVRLPNNAALATAVTNT